MLTELEINAELDKFEALAALSTARARSVAEAEAARRHAAEQAAARATVAQSKERLRGILDEYCDIVRSLDTMPLNPDMWRQLHMLSVEGNRAIKRITGDAAFTFISPVGGGLIETIFKRWGIECAHSATRERYSAQIKPLSETLNIRRIRQDVEGVLDW